jgi:hypothetical protein
MTWLAVLLIGAGVADLAHSIRPAPTVNACVGAAGSVAVGLLAGLTDLREVLVLVLVAAVVVAWELSVTRGFGRGPAWLPLLVLGSALALGTLFSATAPAPDGPLADWLGAVQVPVLAGIGAERFLVVLAAFLVQLSTGNVIVRLVLAATGTVNPAMHGLPDDPELRLKGGRLLGPMERVFILGLGMAGHLTAASIVIAAKGLLRFPELQSRSEQARIHQLTEYFLVGSFVSWLVALASLVLLLP